MSHQSGRLNSRREFLVRSSTLTLTLPFWARAAHSFATNEGRLRLASVGVAGMGGADLSSLSSHAQVDVVALCDVDSKRLKSAGEKHLNAKQFTDYRKMLDEMHDQIDAVQVSTPDHTHAPAALSAMSRGKHVYCQKPLTHDVYESRQMRSLSQQKKLVTQMGTQIHSHTDYRTAVSLIQSGVIGQVKEVHSWSSKTWGYDGPDPMPSQVPTNLDWNLWLGTAPERPYSEKQYHPADWRRWYDFGCGTMGDMAIHILDPVFTALQLGAPLRIVSISPEPPKRSYGMKNQTHYTFGPSKFTTDRFVLTWSDGGLMPDTSSWPKQSGKEGKESKLPDQGSMFVGTKGYVLLPHVAQPILLPESNFASTAIQRQPNGNHYHLFVDACLGGAPTTAHFAYAGSLTEAVLLGVLANRFPQQELQWNAEAMNIPNHAMANSLLRRQYRSGFEINVPIS
ncbi:MAG TPA: Gfo/Idh/MocA family oxidoreductase [Pirellula sp.]|nr:Gfo/Idh/MocA family oxidoreductase [Pirellula sp.]